MRAFTTAILIPAVAIGAIGFAAANMMDVRFTDQASDDPATTVAVNGKIYTMNEEQPWAEAVVIRGTDIVYVGDNEGARAFIDENTTVGDLGGRMVLPGFIDTHMHLFPMMFFSSGLVLENTQDPARMLAAICEYVEQNPDGPFFSYAGAWEGSVEITRQQIDECIADKPFIMIGRGGHGGWANSKALEMSGIVPGNPDPVDSWTRDENDMPTGEVGSSPAIWWMVRDLKLIRKDGILRTAEKVLKAPARGGITTSFEAATFEGTAEAVFSAVHELETSGRLTARIIAGSMIQRDYNVEGALAELKKWGPVYSSDMFNVNYLKIHGDGSPDNRTAAMLEHYRDTPDAFGFLALKPDELKEAMLTVAGWGYNIHTHTVGDRAVRWALDGFQAVREAGYDQVRLNTGHTQFVHPDDKPRFAELNVGADVFAGISYPLASTLAVITDEQARRYAPIKSLIDAGARVGFSADYPVADLNPFRNMYIAMTRTEPGTDNRLETLDEAVDLETALKCYTVNSAYMVGMEDKVGSIEVGKKADLVVIDRNIFEIPTEELLDVNVLATMVDGKVVFEEAIAWDLPGDEPQVADCPDEGKWECTDWRVRSSK